MPFETVPRPAPGLGRFIGPPESFVIQRAANGFIVTKQFGTEVFIEPSFDAVITRLRSLIDAPPPASNHAQHMAQVEADQEKSAEAFVKSCAKHSGLTLKEYRAVAKEQAKHLIDPLGLGEGEED